MTKLPKAHGADLWGAGPVQHFHNFSGNAPAGAALALTREWELLALGLVGAFEGDHWEGHELTPQFHSRELVNNIVNLAEGFFSLPGEPRVFKCEAFQGWEGRTKKWQRHRDGFSDYHGDWLKMLLPELARLKGPGRFILVGPGNELHADSWRPGGMAEKVIREIHAAGLDSQGGVYLDSFNAEGWEGDPLDAMRKAGARYVCATDRDGRMGDLCVTDHLPAMSEAHAKWLARNVEGPLLVVGVSSATGGLPGTTRAVGRDRHEVGDSLWRVMRDTQEVPGDKPPPPPPPPDPDPPGPNPDRPLDPRRVRDRLDRLDTRIQAQGAEFRRRLKALEGAANPEEKP